ncbi:MAG: hypothetical protein ACYDER_07135 [Ktedonobacteraceae bacterium]
MSDGEISLKPELTEQHEKIAQNTTSRQVLLASIEVYLIITFLGICLAGTILGAVGKLPSVCVEIAGGGGLVSLLSVIAVLAGFFGKSFNQRWKRAKHLHFRLSLASIGTTLVLTAVYLFVPVFQLVPDANANPYPPNTGNLVFNDPLSNNGLGHNWQQGTNVNNATCQFSGSSLEVTQPKLGYFHGCTAYNTNFSNFAYEVQMTLIKGDYGGIAFCINTMLGNYYHFDVGTNGLYSLTAFARDMPIITLSSSKTSIINTGLNQTNTLAVVVDNGTISLYVNLRLITTINDTTYTSGQIGVYVGDNNHATEALFTDARVWQL